MKVKAELNYLKFHLLPTCFNFSFLQSPTALSRNLLPRGLVARSDMAQKGSDVVVLSVFVTF